MLDRGLRASVVHLLALDVIAKTINFLQHDG